MHLLVFTSILSTFLYGTLVDFKLLFLQSLIILIYLYFAYKRDHSETTVQRKVCVANWSAPEDPSCYCSIELDCETIDSFIDAYNQKNQAEQITYTHFFLKLLGLSFRKSPSANGTMSFGQFVPFEGVHISALVDVNVQGKDLKTVTLNNCESLSYSEIHGIINKRVKSSKSNQKNSENQNTFTSLLPAPLVSCLLAVGSFVSYYLGTGLGLFKLRKYHFGNVLLANLSLMDIYDSFVPLVGFSNSILVATICKPRKRAVVATDGQMVARKTINLNVVFDHRFADAVGMSPALDEIYRLAQSPEETLEQ